MSSSAKSQKAGDLVGTSADAGLHSEGELSRYSTDERSRLRALMDAGDASDADLDVLAMVAERSGLDPFLKQIYLVGRKTKVGGYRGEPERWETKWTVQSSIDGLREVLFRTADAKGVDCSIGRPVWFDSEGNAHRFWAGKENPTACEVEVTLGGRTGYGIATWEQFVQTKGIYKDGKRTSEVPNSMWSQMGPHMLAKCAKALAIRDVCSLASGIYIPEEMGQASNRITAEARRMDSPAARGSDGLRAHLALAPQQPQNTAEDSPAPGMKVEALAAIESAASRPELKAVMDSYTAEVLGDAYEEVRAAGSARWGALAPEAVAEGGDE